MPSNDDVLLRPEAVHDLDLLGEVLEPLAQRREREAERLVLELVPAGAHAELDAAARDVVGGRHGVREQRRVAERHRRDERPEAELRRQAASPAIVVHASCAARSCGFENER